MQMESSKDLDVVGIWTEIKLEIIHEYAKAYAKIVGRYFNFAYIDGFAGAGTHISKTTGKEISGSPQVALSVTPNFSHYHFVDLDEKRVAYLQGLAKDRKNVSVYQGDCNSELIEKVFPQCRYEDYRRALCLLDPYNLNPHWDVVKTAGKMKTIDLFLNFMIMDANMNILWKNPNRVSPDQAERMTKFWGDDSWRTTAYRKDTGLFEEMEEKVSNSNEAIVSAYKKRLSDIAGFKCVPDPLPMKNSKGAIVYYLFFASPDETGAKIAKSIFKKYRNKRW